MLPSGLPQVKTFPGAPRAGARRSQEELGAARRSQEEPGRVRRSEGEPVLYIGCWSTYWLLAIAGVVLHDTPKVH